jgi:hypothetical protein
MRLRREVLEQERHAGLDVGAVDEVVVVQHEVDVVRHTAELVDHRGEDGLDRWWADCRSRSALVPTPGTAACMAVIR